jgi:hypothetical protein
MPVDGWNCCRDPVSEGDEGEEGGQAGGETYFAGHCVGFVDGGVVVVQLTQRERSRGAANWISMGRRLPGLRDFAAN